MDTPGELHPVSNLVHQLPTLNTQCDPRASAAAAGQSAVDLKSCFNTLYQSRWLVGGVTLLVTAMAVLYSLVAKPVYESNLMIHVEEESPNASKNILSEAALLFETKKAAIAQMELLRSRMVVSRAVDKLLLYVEAQPKYFPIAGFQIAERARGGLSEPGIFGWGGYLWGGEKIEVGVFNVPVRLENREFTVTARGNQRYRFGGGGGAPAFDGTVGKRYLVPTADGSVELRVGKLHAKAGAQFLLRRMSRMGTIERIQNAMAITEQGKLSGVIEVRLQGDSAKRVNQLLSEIGREYMRQNLARKTEEAEKSLAFLNQQLPILKRQLEQSEARYNHFRNTHGTIDLREEARMSLQQAAAARSRRLDLIQKKTGLLSRFASDHPVIKSADGQREEVDRELADAATRIRTLPVLEQEETRLVREIKVSADLYTALSNTAQQLRLISGGRVSNVRMIDAPIAPEKPLKPNRPLTVGLAVTTGLFLGVLLALGRKAINGGIDTPEAIEHLLRARAVYATIPHSPRQEKLARKVRDSGLLPLLAQAAPDDIAIESLRSFRAALQFSMPHFRNNVVMLAGPTRGLGKSFVAANFAAVMAASGKRVLLIDADLRNGLLHRYFGVGRDPGLSQALGGAAPPGQVIHRGVMENLDFIPTGALPASRSEFLLEINFSALLQAVSADYDLVLLAPPPILAVADALSIGANAGAVFILARAGLTTEADISESIKRLNHAGIAPQGLLFNDMAPGIGRGGALYRSEAVGQIGYSV